MGPDQRRGSPGSRRGLRRPVHPGNFSSRHRQPGRPGQVTRACTAEPPPGGPAVQVESGVTDYEQAFWTTAGAGGDIDTTCAIVGGIVAAHVGFDGLPEHWRASCEPLPDWVRTTR
ncbi:ADP-ribosylglycohydrolase family protein [Kribbella orskensis]|uniref:ADP-ribosylglycohydrolase family protein n=1 Tax=Kribbella TaxID=182639 RepID=UPI0034E21305